MRLTASTLALCTALLFATAASASPGNSSDDMDRLMLERGLLTHIDQVRQNVSNRASELVVTAMGFLGVPYKRGGNSAETGFDCSGFVRAIYQQSIGLMLPRRAEQQAAA
ncbi:MAG: peptidoglycan endopeptidase, partial [Haliea sp.]